MATINSSFIICIIIILYYLININHCQQIFLNVTSYEQIDDTLYLTGFGFGSDPNLLTISMGQIKYNDIPNNIKGEIKMEVDSTQISIQLKDGSKNKEFTISSVIYNTAIPDIVLKPRILSLSSNIPTWSTGSVIMYGKYFEASSNDNQIKVYQDNREISFLPVSSGLRKDLILYTRTGGGITEFKVLVDGKYSDVYSTTYDAPSITQVSKPKYKSTDLLTIDGDNFSYTSNDGKTIISFGGQQCTSIDSFSKTRLVVSCNNNIVQQSIPVTVNVNGLSVSSNTNYEPINFKQLQVLDNGFLEIKIQYYTDDATISICNSDITQYCSKQTESPDFISTLLCDIPSSVQINSGSIEIKRPNLDSHSTLINLRPYITSINPINDIPTSGIQTVTLSGKYLNELDCSGTSNIIRVNYRDVDLNGINFIDSSKITFTLPSGSGAQNKLFITSHSYTQGIQTFNVQYSNPAIYSSTTNNNIVTIYGNDLGEDASLIELWYFEQKIETSSITITTPHTQIQFPFTPNSINIKKTYNITVNGLSSPNYVEPLVISSSSLFYKVPGNITIEADDFQADDLKVYVSDVECTNPYSLNSNTIICYFDASVEPDIQGRALNISITSAGLTGINEVFYYYDIINECKFNCSNHGTCNKKSGECICFQGWQGLYCQEETSTSSQLPPPIIDDNGNTVVIGGKLNFTISILYLRENDILGKQVKLLKLSDLNWENRTKINENQHYYRGKFINGEIIELDVNYYKDKTNYSFAGDEIIIPSNSMKYIISISNYQFLSVTNNLEVIYNSKTKLYSSDGCNTVKTNDDYYSSTNNANDQININWFQVTSADTIFQTKFSKRIFIDNKIRKSTTKILDYSDNLYTELNNTNDKEEFYNRLISIESPNFSNKLILDPSFSALLRSNNSECKENNWKIPLIVTLTVVGGISILVAVSIFIFKKYRTSILSQNFVIKLRSLNN